MTRYVMTGGDNGYCCQCGGLCDRVILAIDDEKKTYSGIDGGNGFCLGKYCWRATPCGDFLLKRYKKVKVYGGVATDEIECYGGDRLYLVKLDADGNEIEKHKVVVKGQKWGKDGEYKTWRGGKIVWDKVQNYKFLGWGKV